MKRWFYSGIAKWIALLLCALCVSASCYAVTSTFFQEEAFYLFETSYEDSYAASNAVYEEFSALARQLEYTADAETGALHLDRMYDLPAPELWEFYLQTEGGSYTNTEADSYESFLDAPLAMGVRVQPGSKLRTGFSNLRGHGYYFPVTDQSYALCVKMGESLAAEKRAEWNTLKTTANHAVTRVLALLGLAGVLLVYLLCVTGRKPNSPVISMQLIDRMFVEFTLVLFLGILLGLGSFTLYAVAYFILEEELLVANQLGAAAVFVVVALSTLLLLSLVRNLKNRTFLKRSLLARLCRFGWRTALKLLRRLWSLLKQICGGVRRWMLACKRVVLTLSSKHFDGRWVCVLLAAFSFAVGILSILSLESSACGVLLVLLVGAAMVFVTKRLLGFAALKDGIEKIKNGDLSHKITDCPDGVIGQMAENVNAIGSGLETSLTRELKAERMKAELITNVSHDLKTPLTSILSYAELLAKETLTPAEANDYVKIILQKGERLKQLTYDLFDVSKAQSGNEVFETEELDLCLLIQQAMAELNEQIEAAGLSFKLSAAQEKLWIQGDGKKLSRVFENLFGNCVKYAMPHTRVYIDLTEDKSGVTAVVKNIASYEMTFDETEIADRFVRGDSARSGEGSGLGLAIVKSYVEGCGGRFAIQKDGDLFKAVLCFRKSARLGQA